MTVMGIVDLGNEKNEEDRIVKLKLLENNLMALERGC